MTDTTTPQPANAGAARPLKTLGFIHLVPFDRNDPGKGLREGVELFRYAEELGLDSGWVRTRHLQYGLPSPAVFFAAVAQHTERIGLGSAVIPVGHENPFRLAEDLGTADALSGGRVHAGVSVHPPGYSDAANDLIHDTGWREEDYGYGRIERLRELLDGQPVREVPEYNGIGGDFDSERVEPHSPGLADRLWYGGGSLRSAEWTGRAGFNWLVSNISTTADGDTDFARVQRAQIDAFRAAHPAGDAARATVARVIVPTDGATPEQLRKYEEYAAARTPRTERVHGGKTIIAKDVLGSTADIVDFIRQDRAFQAADDYLFELPFEFELADWKHILHQLATEIGPALGWRPGGAATAGVGAERTRRAGRGVSSPEVRQAARAEYGAIDELITAAYAHDYGSRAGGGDPMHRSEERAREHDVWVAVDPSGTLLGSVTTRRAGGPPLHEDVAADELDLRLLGVSPAARRRGVGAALMREVAAQAGGQGFRAVVLKTAPDMRGAHRLYEALGYTRQPERDGLWIGGSKRLDLFTYAYPLAPLVSAPLNEGATARGILGSFPTGVVAITGGVGHGLGAAPAALAVQSFVSLSVEPPRVLLTVGRGSLSWPRISAGGSFAATVLAAGQGPVARQLARPGHADKLGGIPTVRSPQHGHPVIADGSAWFECEIREEFDGGDHRIVVADVLGFGALGGVAEPLVYARSRFARIGAAAAGA